MPTYQYACTECGHAFDQVQSFSDDALTVCPACTGRLRKVFNAVGVVFKGSGFYRTDSRADARATSGAKGAGGSEKPSGEKSSSDKSSSEKSSSDKSSGKSSDKSGGDTSSSGSSSSSSSNGSSGSSGKATSSSSSGSSSAS